MVRRMGNFFVKYSKRNKVIKLQLWNTLLRKTKFTIPQLIVKSLFYSVRDITSKLHFCRWMFQHLLFDNALEFLRKRGLQHSYLSFPHTLLTISPSQDSNFYSLLFCDVCRFCILRQKLQVRDGEPYFQRSFEAILPM